MGTCYACIAGVLRHTTYCASSTDYASSNIGTPAAPSHLPCSATRRHTVFHIAHRRSVAITTGHWALALIVVMFAPVSPLLSQNAAPRRFTVATNPIAPAFEAVSLEAEVRSGSRGLSVGLGGTYDTNPQYLSWIQAKVKYALRGVALRGGAIGATAGMVVKRGRGNEVFPSVGAVLDWNWFPGAKDRVLLGTGIGMNQLSGTAGKAVDRLQFDGRLVMGMAF